MTVRYPLVFGSIGASVITGPTYTFSGTKSGVLLEYTKLLRVSPSEAVALINAGTIRTANIPSNTRNDMLAHMEWFAIAMDSSPAYYRSGNYYYSYGGNPDDYYIFIRTSNSNGGALNTGWELFFPKEAGTRSWYDTDVNGSQSTLLTYDRWPGNFTAAGITDYPSSLYGYQDLNGTTENNLRAVAFGIYNKHLGVNDAFRTGGQMVSGVQLMQKDGTGSAKVYYPTAPTGGYYSGLDPVTHRPWTDATALVQTAIGDNYTTAIKRPSSWTFYTGAASNRGYIVNLGRMPGGFSSSYLTTDIDAAYLVNRFKDSRIDIRAMSTSNTGFPTPAWPTTQVTMFDRIEQVIERNAFDGTTNPEDLIAEDDRPMYWDGSSMRRMNLTDIRDTFITPALKLMWGEGYAKDTNSSNVVFAAAEDFLPYTVSAASSVSGYSRSAYPILVDTRIDDVAYQPTITQEQYTYWSGWRVRTGYRDVWSHELPMALDQTVTVNNYYLYTKQSLSAMSDSNITSYKNDYVLFDGDGIKRLTYNTLIDKLYPLFAYYMVTDPTWSVRWTAVRNDYAGTAVNNDYGPSIASTGPTADNRVTYCGLKMDDTMWDVDWGNAAGVVNQQVNDDYRSQYTYNFKDKTTPAVGAVRLVQYHV